MLRDKIIKYKELILLSIGSLLIILAFCLLLYDHFEFIKADVFAEIELKKYNEVQKENNNTNIPNEDNNNNNNNQNVTVDTEEIDEEESNDNEQDKPSKPVEKREYIGFLEIDKISLKAGLVSKESYYNNVNRNVEILDVSDYPDVINGNFILASHSGNSKISYFKNLYKLELNDMALVYYKDYVYHYKIVDIYNVPKVGSLEIRRDPNETVMTLITCTKDSKTEQTVYILELSSKTRNGGNND